MAIPKPELRWIDNGNGQQLASQWYVPSEKPCGAVMIAPAIGVKQRFYADFAAWLATQGYLTVTFDYVGIGQSRRSSLRKLKVDVLDWARHDASAMLDQLANAADGLPLYWIGHSLGAQILPMVRGNDRLSRIITIAAGSGYWRDNSPQVRKQAWFLWYALAPVLTGIAGYFPGERLGAVGDLPAGVIRQWRRWCLHPDYLIGIEGEPVQSAFDAVRTPLVSLSFSDDEMMSARSTESLHSFYRSAPKTMHRIAPNEIGVSRIGHFDFFRKHFQDNLWAPHLLPALQPKPEP